MTVVICIDGCNGVGKSTFIHQFQKKLRMQGYITRHITDSLIYKDVEKYSTSFPRRRHFYRVKYVTEKVDVVFQERGMVSHLFFDHCNNRLINPCLDCYLEDTPSILKKIFFYCSPEIQKNRLLNRDGIIPESNKSDCDRFMNIAKSLGWECIDTSNNPLLSAFANRLYEVIRHASARIGR